MSESLDDFFTVNVTATTDTQTRAGFGTALFACCDVPWTSGARVREYASLAEVATAGFNSSKPGYRMAQAAFSQNPRPRSVKIGRRTRAFTQVVRLTRQRRSMPLPPRRTPPRSTASPRPSPATRRRPSPRCARASPRPSMR